MTPDPYTVAVVLVTGAVAVSAVVVTAAVGYGLVGGAFWLAMRLEDRAQERNAATLARTEDAR